MAMAVSGAQPAFGTPDDAAEAALGIVRDSPDADQALPKGINQFRGHLTFGSADVGTTDVVFAVDASGSTSSPSGMDCNADGAVDAQDDYNGDGNQGDVLDCEIAAVSALNAQLSTIPGANAIPDPTIRVRIVAFGSSAAAAKMNPDPNADSTFTAPGWFGSGEGADVLSRVDEVASSITRGQIGKFEQHSVSTGTNFDAALQTSIHALSASSGQKWVMFLSDGQSSVSQSTLDQLAGIKVRSFAVGSGAQCSAGSPLERIATATGEQCVTVADPSTLTTGLTNSTPADVASVTLTYGGTDYPATLDALGNFSADLDIASGTGSDSVTVTATKKDGTTTTASWPITLGGKTTYLALGDSYASGEGVEPYRGKYTTETIRYEVPQPVPEPGLALPPSLTGPEYRTATIRAMDIDYACHRSQKSWADGVHALMPELDLDFRACSGARIPNLLSSPQEKIVSNGTPVANPPQLDDIPASTRDVSVSIGGNDLAFAGIVKKCLLNLGTDCSNENFANTGLTSRKWANIRLALFSTQVGPVYQTITDRTPGAGRVVTTYPRLFAADGYKSFKGIGLITKDEAEWIRSRVDVASEIIKLRGGQNGFTVVDLREPFEGHLLGDKDSYIIGVEHTLEQGNDPDTSGFVASKLIHPDENGVNLYTTAIQDAMSGGHFPNSNGAYSARSGRAVTVQEASDTSGLSAEDLMIINDPEQYLAQFTPEQIAEVADYVQGSAQLTSASLASCGFVTASDPVYVLADGFAPGSEVTLDVTGLGDAVVQYTATADTNGTVAMALPSPDAKDTTVSIDVHGADLDSAGTRHALATYVTGGECTADSGTGSLGSGSLGSMGSSGSLGSLFGSLAD